VNGYLFSAMSDPDALGFVIRRAVYEDLELIYRHKALGTVVDGEDANYTQHFTSGESSLANRRRHEVPSDEFLAVLGEGKKNIFLRFANPIGPVCVGV